MDNSSSLGMYPRTPQEISKKYKRQSLGMPKASPLHQQKAPGHFSMRYIFIASCNMCYSWSIFIFCCVFYFSIKLDPIILYFGVRHAPLFLAETTPPSSSCLLYQPHTSLSSLWLPLSSHEFSSQNQIGRAHV